MELLSSCNLVLVVAIKYPASLPKWLKKLTCFGEVICDIYKLIVGLDKG